MKKIFKKAFVVLGIAGMGLGTASCNTEELLNTWLPIVTEVLGNMLNNSGATSSYNFEGTLKVDSYTYDSEENTYEAESKASNSVQINTEIAVSTADSVITVQFGEFKVGDNKISNFAFNTNYNPGNGQIGLDKESYYTGGTCSVNGVESTIEMACMLGTVNDQKLNITFFDFYVGGKKYEGTFTGDIVNAEQ